MRDVIVTVRCSTEWIGDPAKITTQEKVNEAVKEAIEECLHYTANRGFHHGMSDDLSIIPLEVNAWTLDLKEKAP